MYTNNITDDYILKLNKELTTSTQMEGMQMFLKVYSITLMKLIARDTSKYITMKILYYNYIHFCFHNVNGRGKSVS